MMTSLQRTIGSRSAAWLLAIAAGAGCQIIAGIDRSDIGTNGSGGSLPSDGSIAGTGGSSGSDQDSAPSDDGSVDDVSIAMDTGAGGTGTAGTGGAGGAAGMGGTGGVTPPNDGGGATTNTGGGSAGGGMTDGPVTVPEAGTACGAALPAGWTLVVHSSTNTACPTGFGTTTHALVASATPGTNACTCSSCAVTQAGACGSGTVSASVAPGQGNDACVNAWFTNVSASGCTTVPAVGADHVQVTATLTGSGGTCSPGAATANSAQLTVTRQSWCDVGTQQQIDSVCGGTVPAGFAACIMSAGTVSCPTGWAASPPIQVHDSASLSCSVCSACSVQTSCAGGSLAGFSTTTCGGTRVDIPIGGCVATNPNETALASIMVTGTPASTCSNGSSTGSATLTGPRTFCCR